MNITIDLIARHPTAAEHSTDSTYEFRYYPPMENGLRGKIVGSFELALIESVVKLPHDTHQNIEVRLAGRFLPVQFDQLKSLFDMYSKAEGIRICYKTTFL